MAYLKQRELKRSKDATVEEALIKAPHRAEFLRIMQDADRRIHEIPGFGPAIASIKRDFPETFAELSVEWMDRLSAAVGVVSIERFAELADQFVCRTIELVSMARRYYTGDGETAWAIHNNIASE